MSRFLLEIGVENLPAAYVEPAAKQLRNGVADLLDRARLEHGDVHMAATLRRLVVIVDDVSDRQSVSEEIVTGPPADRAYDEAGRPTKAAEGFARARGVPVSRLISVETARGVFVGLRTKLPRRATATVLRDELPGVLSSLRFARAMKWEPSGTRFARPVRWIVALLGSRVVKFRFADVTSGNRTWARPWMPGESAALRSSSSWESAMRRLGVRPEPAVRRQRVEKQARALAERVEARVVDDPELFEELSWMCEDPRPLAGGFDASYLSLPREVVTTAMRSHQRYVALEDRRGRLVSRFITFTDGRVGSPTTVRRGNERVLHARLEDAAFYWKTDVARGVDGLADELDRIVFIEGLGTVGQKARRIEAVALAINSATRQMEKFEEGPVRRAARLCKCDLASEMIKDGKEFTRLQGTMGAHYAREAKEPRAVVVAIRDHYLPRNPDERVPRSHLAAIVGVADRMDTICGCFLADLRPTGSQDPYALRRSANGLIRLLERERGVRIDDLARCALDAYATQSEGLAVDETVRAEVVAFLRGRVDAFLRDRGVPFDVAAAVTEVAWARPGEALEHAVEIARRRRDGDFEKLVTGVRRAGNILDETRRVQGAGYEAIESALDGGSSSGGLIPVDASVFEDPSEGALHDAVKKTLEELRRTEDGPFSAVLSCLARLSGPIDAFFDAVLVNCEDSRVRENRHALLSAIYALFSRYADFSRIVEARGE